MCEGSAQMLNDEMNVIAILSWILYAHATCGTLCAFVH